MTRWADSCSSSQASVMSKNSFSSRMSRNAELMFRSKSFHLRQNFSDDMVSGRLFFPSLVQKRSGYHHNSCRGWGGLISNSWSHGRLKCRTVLFLCHSLTNLSEILNSPAKPHLKQIKCIIIYENKYLCNAVLRIRFWLNPELFLDPELFFRIRIQTKIK